MDWALGQDWRNKFAQKIGEKTCWNIEKRGVGYHFGGSRELEQDVRTCEGYGSVAASDISVVRNISVSILKPT